MADLETSNQGITSRENPLLQPNLKNSWDKFHAFRLEQDPNI